MAYIFLAQQPPLVQGLLTHKISRSHTHWRTQSVGFLWAREQLVAETSTWQHKTLTTDKHPYPCGNRTHNLSKRATADLHLRTATGTGHAYISILKWLVTWCGPCSSIGTATELRTGSSGIESRLGRDFPPVQTDPGAHPASCKLGTGSFPWVKCGRDVLLTPHPLLAPRSSK